MAIEAAYSSYRKKNLILAVIVCLGVGGWFAYDGYFNKSYIEENTEDGVANSDLTFNRYYAPPFFAIGALVAGTWFWLANGKKVVADEQSLKAEGRNIDYDRIEAVNKTHFDTKGKFTVIYKDGDGRQDELVLSRYKYDNISAVLDKVVEKIS